MKLSINDQIDRERWRQHAQGKVFHQIEWLEVIAHAYGLEPLFLMAEGDEEFALYPGFRVGKRCISLPYLYLSGFLSNSPQACHQIEDYLCEQGLATRYRQLQPDQGSGQITAVVKIDELEGYRKSLSQKMRNQLRKAGEQGFELRQESDLGSFYALYARKMHQHGTPVHCASFFAGILQQVAGAAVYTAYQQDRPVASMLALTGEDLTTGERTMFIMWAASDPRYDAGYANYFLYWSVFREGLEKGVHRFDLGTAQHGSSHHSFKLKWRPEVFAVVANDEQARNYKENRLMQLASRVWRHLPFPLATWLGPRLRKRLV